MDKNPRRDFIFIFNICNIDSAYFSSSLLPTYEIETYNQTRRKKYDVFRVRVKRHNICFTCYFMSGFFVCFCFLFFFLFVCMCLTNTALITHFIILSVYDYYLTILCFLCKLITIVFTISPMFIVFIKLLIDFQNFL